MSVEVRLWALDGIPEVNAGDDVAALIARASAAHPGAEIAAGDIVVVASKIVAKAEGRLVTDAARSELVDRESVRLVAARRTPEGVTKVVESAAGPVMAAAGVDASNLGGVDDGAASLLLPQDSDTSARSIRSGLARELGIEESMLGVIVTDTTSRPWRLGVFDFALGAAGVTLLEDLRGSRDGAGRTMEVTVRALADEISSAADLVKGKSDRRPVAVVRGLAGMLAEQDAVVGSPTASARNLSRTGATDWFRYGHVEAVRAALGVDPARVEAPTIDPFAEEVTVRAQRAIEIAMRADLAASGWAVSAEHAKALPDGGTDIASPRAFDAVTITIGRSARAYVRGDWIALGELSERLRIAAWSENLAPTIVWPDEADSAQ